MAGKKGIQVSTTATAVERRLQIHTLRAAGNDWETISATIGLKDSTCKLYLKAAIEVDGLAPIPDLGGTGSVIAERNPEQAAEFLATAMDPFVKNLSELREVCKKLGMKPSLVQGLMKRLQAQYAPVVETGKRMLAEEMLDMLREKIYLVSNYLDEYSVATMDGKNLGVVLGILVDRHELLAGRPTQRIDFTAHMQIQESMPLLLAEAKRRGITIDGAVTDVVPMAERVES